VHAAPLNTCKSWGAIHHHRTTTANHRGACGESGMSSEAYRHSTATLSPRG
jgi:hypothetical protein